MAPNVLFITVDQWRGDCLSAAGHPVVETPNIDALAAEGVHFTQHFANSTPCGPSRAGIHTGTYQLHHRSVQNGTPLDHTLTTLPLEVRAAGRTPHLLGYTDTTMDPRTLAARDPRLRTYESVMAGWSSPVDITELDPPWVEHLASLGYDTSGDFWDLYAPADVPGADEHGPTWAPTRIPAEHCETTFLTDRAISLLRTLDEPFFLHLSYLRPHPPYRAPAPYHDLYDPADVPPFARHADRDVEAAMHLFTAGALGLASTAAPVDERDCRQLVATYYGLVRLVDDELGRLFQHLRDSGRWEDTVVVLTSDHGEQAGDHWLVQKLGWYDSSYHVPLLVHDPRHAEQHGTRVDALTEHVDLLPTLLGLLDVDDVPLQCDGRSLEPFLRGEQPPEWREHVFFQFDFRTPPSAAAGGDDAVADVPQRERGEPAGPLGMRTADCCLDVVRTAHDKYVHFPTLPPLYFDLDDDPGELHDRAGDPAYQGQVLEAVQRLASHRMRNDERALANTVVTPGGPLRWDDRLP